MKKKQTRRFFVALLAAFYLFGVGLFTFRYLEKGENWAFHPSNDHLYSGGALIGMGKITDRDGNVLADTIENERVYADSTDVRKATIHALGDSKGFISTGVQNALRDRLVGYSVVNGLYTYTGNGNNAVLTLDSELSVAAMKALGNQTGCVGVCNYQTGEMLCMVSTPTFDVTNETESARAQAGELGSVFVNRFLSSTYTPGSTFKMVTAAAALEKNGDAAYDTAFTCQYGTEIGDETLSCVGRHNSITLKKAFSHSCNAYFSQLSVSLGRETMTKYAEMFGFNQSFSLDGIKAATSSFSVGDSRDIDFGWSGIGQYTDQMNPLQYLCAVCAVAHGGDYIKPYLIKSISASDGDTVYEAKQSSVRMLKKSTAGQIAGLMDFAVSDNYKKSTFGGLNVCGKTGTAEVGEGVENSLFIGYVDDSKLPVAFVVVVEGGGAGRASAMTVANRVLQAAK